MMLSGKSWNVVVAVLALLASLATSTCRATLTPGNHKYTLSVNAETRKYTLHVPPQYDGETAIPLLFDLHVGLLCCNAMRRGDATTVQPGTADGLFMFETRTHLASPPPVLCRRPGEATSSSRAG